MSEKRGIHSPFFLDSSKIREILKKGSDSLLLSASDSEIDRAVKLIESMRDDLEKISNMPISDEVAKEFKSHEKLTLQEIEEFYSKWQK